MNFNGVFSAQTFRQDIEIVHFMWSCRDRHCGGRSRRVAGQAEAPAEEHLTPNSGGSEPMYLPELFRVEDVPQMHALMRARPFAALVSAGSAGLFASHLPTVLKDEGRYGVIECHLARANPHWRDLADGGEALMIFQGAEGYITPNWYPSKAEGGKVVPTWNFAVVHAYGRAEVMNDEGWLRRHVTELTAQQEKDQPRPWAPSDAPANFITTMLRGIVGFRFAVTRLEGKWKMSQNRTPKDRDGVVKGLALRDRGDDREIAELVARHTTPGDAGS
jgi:transcriptional regulator